MRIGVMLFGVALAATVVFGAWESIGPDGGSIIAMAIDPKNAERVYASSDDYPDNVRVFLSANAGASWAEQGRLPDTYVTALAVDPSAQSRLYALGSVNVFHRSTDGGRTWASVVLPGYGMALAVDRLVAGRLYLAGYYFHNNGYRAAAFVSTDFGARWTVSMPEPDTASYGYSVAADPVEAGTVYLGTGSGQLHRSTDAGQTWQRRSDGLAPGVSITTLSVSPADNRVVLAATSAGFFRTIDCGGRWSPVGEFIHTQSAAFSPADGEIAYGLAWTDAMRVCVSTDAGATWTVPSPGYVVLKDANLCADPGAAATVWVNTQTGIYRSTDSGANWRPAHSGLRLTRVPAIAASPADARRIYLSANGDGVYRTTDGGDSWLRCGSFLACDNIAGIGVAPGANDAVYALEGSG